MAIDTKKYLDYAGLQQFWGLVKSYYTKEDGTGSVVDNAKKLSENLVFKVGSTTGSVLGTTRFDQAENKYEVYFNDTYLGKVDDVRVKERNGAPVSVVVDKIATIDLSAYAKLEDIAKVFEYKGEKKGSELRAMMSNPGDAQTGWMYTCSEDDLTAEPKFHKGYEYVAVVSATTPKTLTWVELGNYIDLSDYYKKAEVDAKLALKADVTSLTSEVNRATAAESALSDRLDIIEGEDTVDGSIKKALKDAKAYADDKVAVEATDRSNADTTLQTNIDNEASARETADTLIQAEVAVEESARKSGDADVYNAILSIEDYKIRQMFINNKVTAATEATLIEAINNMTESDVVVTLAANVPLTQRLAVAEGKNVIIDLNGKTLSSPANDRAVNVAPGGYCAITNGTVSGNNDSYNIVVRGNGNLGTEGSTLILDNVKMTNSGQYNLLLATNGNDSDVKIVLNGCTFDGTMYLPAMGSIIFNGGEFSATNKPVLYVKNGCPLELNNVKMTMTVDSSYNAQWAHFENGALDSPAALVVEACNYALKGNPSVIIRDGEFNAYGIEQTGEVFDILLINYNGNAPVKFESNVPYYKTINVTGHVTVDGVTAPTDGWLNFTREAGHGMASVERIGE